LYEDKIKQTTPLKGNRLSTFDPMVDFQIRPGVGKGWFTGRSGRAGNQLRGVARLSIPDAKWHYGSVRAAADPGRTAGPE
jgi:hypothetical protein